MGGGVKTCRSYAEQVGHLASRGMDIGDPEIARSLASRSGPCPCQPAMLLPTLVAMLSVGSIVIRVDDIDAQSQFWAEALGYTVREPASPDFVVLTPLEGTGPNVSLDAVHSQRVLPPRLHLDLYSENKLADVARLTALGAREVHWDGQPTDADYIIMEDPEGNRFCVVDSTP